MDTFKEILRLAGGLILLSLPHIVPMALEACYH